MKRILLVEDSEDIRWSLAELLTAEGYSVHEAENGAQALRALEGAPELPDLILLDLWMPAMDGVSFRARQQADARLAPIPVLLMSASADLPVRARELGVEGYLMKPFADIESILSQVAGAL
jgi:CheY-like chemotaxis protein